MGAIINDWEKIKGKDKEKSDVVDAEKKKKTSTAEFILWGITARTQPQMSIRSQCFKSANHKTWLGCNGGDSGIDPPISKLDICHIRRENGLEKLEIMLEFHGFSVLLLKIM